jgi:choice-of-anchor A domain-containing protein
MRFFPSLFFTAVLLPVLLAPATVKADEVHSWCVTGTPLNYPSVASDAITAEIINHVCSEHLYFRCCSQHAGGRWDLACVQEGARFATQQNLGDICGRDAWAQGPIAGTQQYYPRDFNLFVLGNASGFTDSEGPIAAQGNLTAKSFNFNWGQKETVALVAQGSLDLTSGQVSGSAHYGTSYKNRGGVTFKNATEPTAPSTPVGFASAADKLRKMSLALKAYNAVPAKKLYSTVTFTGSDPELNVFSVNASLLTGTYSYVMNVPQDAYVIINVSGTNPVIQYAGFERKNGLGTQKILWNFHDATKLQFTGISFPGSLLAPNADAVLRSGNINGTAVVKSASGPDWFELHRAPYDVPSFSCATPTFDPTIWNDPANRGTNNCYNYANNVLLDHFGDPGRASGEWCNPQEDLSCLNGPQIARYAQNDGLVLTTATAICPNHGTKVALFIKTYMGLDAHWWRQDSDGTWSGKNGSNDAMKYLDTPDKITDKQLIGYFCTCSSRTQGGGHAVID